MNMAKIAFGEAVARAVEITIEQDKEVGFFYDRVTKRLLTPIIISNSNEYIDLFNDNQHRYWLMMKKRDSGRLGCFHTHPSGNGFSIADLNCEDNEMTMACPCDKHSYIFHQCLGIASSDSITYVRARNLDSKYLDERENYLEYHSILRILGEHSWKIRRGKFVEYKEIMAILRRHIKR